MDWFLYDNGLRHEKVKKAVQKNISQSSKFLFLSSSRSSTQEARKHCEIFR